MSKQWPLLTYNLQGLCYIRHDHHIFFVSYGFSLGSCIGFSVRFSVHQLIGRLLPRLIGWLLVRFFEGFLLHCVGDLNRCWVLRWEGLLGSQIGWWHGGVALTAILQWQRDGKLFDDGERDCLQWQCYRELEAAWRCGVESKPAMTT
jgi:hypothetical protein